MAEAAARVGSRHRGFERIYLAGLFIVFSALAFLFPPSGDDWAWGSKIGTDRLHDWFRDYNGRYAGNLAVIALTRTHWLTPFIVGAVVALIVFLVVDLAELRTPLGYLVTTTLFLAMPRGEWREAIVWLSGFTNYAIAVAGALVFARAAKQDWCRPAADRPAWWRSVLALLVAFVAGLFMENVTIYLVVAAAVWIIAFGLVRRRFSIEAAAWLAGFVVAAAVMFSNGAYRAAAHSGGGVHYQRIQRTGLATKLRTLGDQIYRYAVGNNTVLNIVLVLLVCLLAGAALPRIGARRAMAPAVLAGAFLLADQLLLLVEQHLTPSADARSVGGLGGLALLIAVGASAVWLVTDIRRRVQLIVCCVSVLVLVAPLASVTPIGPRCFLASYAAFLVIVATLLNELTTRSGVNFSRRVAPFVGAIGATLLASYFLVYAFVHHSAEHRLAKIRRAVDRGATTVRIPALPFSTWVHFGDPKGDPVWAQRYKLYYGLPSELQIKVTPTKP